MEQKDTLVVKHNDFIQKASYNLTAQQQKLLCLVISKIKPTDAEFERYTISALDFAELTGVDKTNVYREFKQMIEAMDNKATWLKIGDDTIRFRVFSESEYNDRQGSITLVLNSRLKKYLLEISHNYTMYELWNVLSLKSKYSIRLYELFKSYAYKHTIEFEYEELKSLLCAENYKLYAKFKERVLDKAISEINRYTNLNVSFTANKQGRSHKVERIVFNIAQKQSLEAYGAYLKTVERINKKTGQTVGQMSIFDLTREDFISNNGSRL